MSSAGAGDQLHVGDLRLAMDHGVGDADFPDDDVQVGKGWAMGEQEPAGYSR